MSRNQVLEAARAGIEQVVLRSRGITDPVVRALAESTAAGTDVPPLIRAVLSSMSDVDYAQTMKTASTVSVTGLWERAKVAYATDADLMEYLTARETAVPAGILRALPHPDPYVMLPPSGAGDGPAGDIGIPHGAFVFGRFNDGYRLCSTADPRMTDLGVMFSISHPDRPGRVYSMRCLIPLPDGDTEMTTVGDVITSTVARFHYGNERTGTTAAQREAVGSWLETYIPQIFGTLMYVCTDQPDTDQWSLRDRPARKKKQSRRPNRRARHERPADPDTIISLGFRLGPALREAQARHEQARASGGDRTAAGWKQPPHQRRPHLRTYWTGKGGTVPQLRFVQSYWVGLDQLDSAPATATVRPVRRPPGRGQGGPGQGMTMS